MEKVGCDVTEGIVTQAGGVVDQLWVQAGGDPSQIRDESGERKLPGLREVISDLGVALAMSVKDCRDNKDNPLAFCRIVDKLNESVASGDVSPDMVFRLIVAANEWAKGTG